MHVRLSTLLAVYVVVPLCLGVAVLDQVFLGGQIQQALPREPESLFLYALIFNVPHIIASFFSMAEKEYFLFYKKRLLYAAPIIFIVSFLGYQYGVYWIFIFGIIYTEYHQISQQIGIGRFYFKTKLPEYQVWRLLMVSIATIGYGLVYQDSLFTQTFVHTVLLPAAGVLTFIFALLSVRMYSRIAAREGRLYLGTVLAAVAGEILILFAGYPVLVILCTRMQHDIPAFLAYMSHDYNREQSGGANPLYKVLSVSRIPIFVLVPIVAMLFAYLLARVPYVAGSLVFGITMIHYYIEGFIWKKGSLHRRHLHFV